MKISSIITTVIVFFIVDVSAQGSYKLLLHNSMDQSPGTIIESSNGRIIFSIAHPYYTLCDLITIDSNGTIVDSIHSSSDSSYSVIHTLCKLSEDSILGFGYKRDSIDYLWMILIDNELNILFDTVFWVGGEIDPRYIYAIPNARGNIVVAFPSYDAQTDGSIVLVELDNSFEIIQHKNIGNPGGGYISVFSLQERMPLKYEIICNKDFSKLSSTGTILDSSFNIVESIYFPWWFNNNNSSISVNNSTNIYSGRIHKSGQSDFDLVVLKLDSIHSVVDSLVIPFLNTQEYTGIHNSLSCARPNKIFIGGTQNISLPNPYFNTGDNYLLLTKIDSNLNIYWQKLFGGDACYVLVSMLATSDGGCVLAATRYDEAINDQELDIIILKINSDGLIMSNNKLPEVNDEIVVYPNPATDKVWIELPNSSNNAHKLEIYLYDFLGRKVSSMPISSSRSQYLLSVQELHRGPYVLHVVQDSWITYSKKIIVY